MKRIAFIIALTGLMSQMWGGWKVEEIATLDKGIIAMTIGKGRNDDTNRIYCWAGNTIKEVTYSDGLWYTVQICSLPSFGGFISTKGGMTLANGHNDGEWQGISFQ